MVLYFPSFIEINDICLYSCVRLRHIWASLNIFIMIFNVRKSVVDFGYILESFKAPGKIVYFTISSLHFVILCKIKAHLGLFFSY